MSNPKIGDKYIIEIDRIYSSKKHEESRYGIKGFRNLVLDRKLIDRQLKWGNIVDADEAERVAYQGGYGVGHYDGMSEAWEIAKKMLHNSPSMYCRDMEDKLDKLTAQEAKALFMMLEEDKPKTNADKFAEVFGNTEYLALADCSWWDEPYKEQDDG